MKRDIIINGELFRSFDGTYFVTDKGEVASISFTKDGKIKKFFRMEQEASKFGYKRTTIYHTQHVLVHRMVFACWSDEELDSSKVIHHIDGNPANNDINNLRQITQKENIGFAIEEGNFGKGGCCKISVYDSVKDEIRFYNSVKEFFIDIKAPAYMVKRGSIDALEKRKAYKERYKVTKLF